MAWLRRHLVTIAAVLALAYLMLPNVVVVAYSFNDPAGRFNYRWNEFSLAAWRDPCAVAGLCESLRTSLAIATLATVVAVGLGTLLAFALARHRFAGRGPTNLLIFLPMATPEVVLGSSLLALFVNAAVVPLGFWTILLAHVMFLLSYVVVTVKARLAGMDARLEQAAMDLYADERTAFVKVTLPLVLPGVAAAALLSFALSFDDFIVTNFTSGSTVTFPMFVWGSAQRGLPPQINVIGAVMFLAALTVVVAGTLLGARRRAGRGRRRQPAAAIRAR